MSAPYIVEWWTATRHPSFKLLFLRTFANAAQSERLLRAVCCTWLTSGEVHAIAGPDIAVSTASPEGVLRFATHCMGRHFVRSSADPEKRLQAAQRRPAFDGRYELQEYPCFDDTWRPTMERLAAVADGILVDVRGYTTTRLGTAFELATLNELPILQCQPFGQFNSGSPRIGQICNVHLCGAPANTVGLIKFYPVRLSLFDKLF